MSYLFFKTLHVIAIICWMAGLLYYLRLFIYHRQNLNDEKICSLLGLMEKRLFKFITAPSMIISWAAALSMIYLSPAMMQQKWLHWKILAVLAMTFYTFFAYSIFKRLRDNPEKAPSEKMLRVYNEVPTVLLVIIVALVIYKPHW